MQPSQDYYDLIDSYKKLHEQEGKFKGISLIPLVPTLIKIVKDNDCKTLLDYGCGKAIPYDKERCREVDLRNPIQELCSLESFDLYDPAYEKYAILPDKKYDVVVCTDVLEHVAEQDIDYVLTKIFFPPIGMFPFIMNVSALIFFSPKFHNKIISKFYQVLTP